MILLKKRLFKDRTCRTWSRPIIFRCFPFVSLPTSINLDKRFSFSFRFSRLFNFRSLLRVFGNLRRKRRWILFNSSLMFTLLNTLLPWYLNWVKNSSMLFVEQFWKQGDTTFVFYFLKILRDLPSTTRILLNFTLSKMISLIRVLTERIVNIRKLVERIAHILWMLTFHFPCVIEKFEVTK